MDINCRTPHLGRFCLPAVSAVTCEVQRTYGLHHIRTTLHMDSLFYLPTGLIDEKNVIIAVLNIN
jgi:hypothetical protein